MGLSDGPRERELRQFPELPGRQRVQGVPFLTQEHLRHFAVPLQRQQRVETGRRRELAPQLEDAFFTFARLFVGLSRARGLGRGGGFAGEGGERLGRGGGSAGEGGERLGRGGGSAGEGGEKLGRGGGPREKVGRGWDGEGVRGRRRGEAGAGRGARGRRREEAGCNSCRVTLRSSFWARASSPGRVRHFQTRQY